MAPAPVLTQRLAGCFAFAYMVASRDRTYAARMDEKTIAMESPAYPESLRNLQAPPAVLFGRGPLIDRLVGGAAWPPAIAIVGARDATAYGLAIARDLARDLAGRGLAIVSGLALGVDGAAHRGALEAGGTTIAVVGSGTDVLYPRAHARLRTEILSTGAVLSELRAGTPSLPHHFPERNRIISGLALGVVVVEATLRSGSLGTARHALEQGREVFAVPGAVTSPRSRGPHALLKAGARLVENADDVVQELPFAVRAACSSGRSGDLSPRCVEIVSRLRQQPSSADEIALVEGRQVAEIWTDLLDLELRGMIVRGSGGRFFAGAAAGASRGTGPGTQG